LKEETDNKKTESAVRVRMKARGKKERRMRNMKERFRLMTTFEGDEMREEDDADDETLRRYTDKIGTEE